MRDKNNEAIVIFETVTAHEFIFMYKKSVKVLADNLCVKIQYVKIRKMKFGLNIVIPTPPVVLSTSISFNGDLTKLSN